MSYCAHCFDGTCHSGHSGAIGVPTSTRTGHDCQNWLMAGKLSKSESLVVCTNAKSGAHREVHTRTVRCFRDIQNLTCYSSCRFFGSLEVQCDSSGDFMLFYALTSRLVSTANFILAACHPAWRTFFATLHQCGTQEIWNIGQTTLVRATNRTRQRCVCVC